MEHNDELTQIETDLEALIGRMQAHRKGREQALVITKLEEADMWLKKAIKIAHDTPKEGQQ